MAAINLDTDYIVEEYRFLRSFGKTDETIARELGLKLDTLQRLLARARTRDTVKP